MQFIDSHASLKDEKFRLSLERGTSIVIELTEQPIDGNFPPVGRVYEPTTTMGQDDDDAHVAVLVILQPGETVDLADELVVPQIAT